jgi:hypothetical protein
MELTFSSILTIIIVIVAIYLAIKFIINPVAKIITGILIVLAVVYILKNFFSINVFELIPFGNYLDVGHWMQILENMLLNFIQSLFKQ